MGSILLEGVDEEAREMCLLMYGEMKESPRKSGVLIGIEVFIYLRTGLHTPRLKKTSTQGPS